jgi:hypothetical protein
MSRITPNVHELKTDPEVFEAVYNGDKTYEIRFNDRDYQSGDILILKETEFSVQEMKSGKQLKYTGRKCESVVTHVLKGPMYGLLDGWVILSIIVLERESGNIHDNPDLIGGMRL